ncbi:MAG TPA: type II toxin-antitoxin system VapC family toxin [Gemmatimonadaceae bacterium]|nr:type II toxin-antitoxin system VapC family toxin [Gemmatimonadaceae bacterium]
MIVVDAAVLGYLLMGGELTPQARSLYQRDPDWVAPSSWRVAFNELLALYHQRGELSLADALQLADEAERILSATMYEVELAQVLQLAAQTGRCAHDCEHAALARELGVPFITGDPGLARALAPGAVSLREV